MIILGFSSCQTRMAIRTNKSSSSTHAFTLIKKKIISDFVHYISRRLPGLGKCLLLDWGVTSLKLQGKFVDLINETGLIMCILFYYIQKC
jgi:hypothetical protein